MTISEYREHYGLPWSTGIASADSREVYRQVSKRRVAEGFVPGGDNRIPPEEFGERMKEYEHRPRAAYRSEIVNLGEWVGASPDSKISADTWTEYLRRIATGRTPAEVSADDDMPKGTCVRDRKNTDEDFAGRYLETLEALPFAVQAKAESLGVRFDEECRRLRGKGLYYHEIATELGVSTMTVHRHARKNGG